MIFRKFQKVLYCILFLCSSWPTHSQSFDIRWGKDNSIENLPDFNRIIGRIDNDLYILLVSEKKRTLFSKTPVTAHVYHVLANLSGENEKEFYIEKYDLKKLAKTGSFKLNMESKSKSRSVILRSASIMNRRVAIFYEDLEDDKVSKLYMDYLDPKTGKWGGEDQVVFEADTKKIPAGAYSFKQMDTAGKYNLIMYIRPIKKEALFSYKIIDQDLNVIHSQDDIRYLSGDPHQTYKTELIIEFDKLFLIDNSLYLFLRTRELNPVKRRPEEESFLSIFENGKTDARYYSFADKNYDISSLNMFYHEPDKTVKCAGIYTSKDGWRRLGTCLFTFSTSTNEILSKKFSPFSEEHYELMKAKKDKGLDGDVGIYQVVQDAKGNILFTLQIHSQYFYQQPKNGTMEGKIFTTQKFEEAFIIDLKPDGEIFKLLKLDTWALARTPDYGTIISDARFIGFDDDAQHLYSLVNGNNVFIMHYDFYAQTTAASATEKPTLYLPGKHGDWSKYIPIMSVLNSETGEFVSHTKYSARKWRYLFSTPALYRLSEKKYLFVEITKRSQKVLTLGELTLE